MYVCMYVSFISNEYKKYQGPGTIKSIIYKNHNKIKTIINKFKTTIHNQIETETDPDRKSIMQCNQ